MPVKWTPDNDQMLLLKILETHPSLTVNTAAVSDAWPNDREKPSARAITERLVRIRKNAGVQFTVKSAQKSSNGVRSVPVTPSKPRAKPNGEAGSGGSSGGKRKRGGGKVVKQEEQNGHEDSDEGGVKISSKEAESLQKEASTIYGDGVVASDDEAGTAENDHGPENGGWNEEGEMEELETPSKRARVDRLEISMAESPFEEDGDEEDEEEGSQYEEM